MLIANRGEIAVRIARACRDAGLASVAVYADPDREARHVRLADTAFALGGATPAESYLRVDKVLAAAAESGADAVHPGYGFLAENADFAAAVIEAGLTWIGPPPDAIRVLGDKVAARHLAARVGAPQVPGTADPVAGPEEVLEFAARARAAGRHQGRVRRRRPGAQGRPDGRGDPGAVRVGGAGGGDGVRPRRVLRRALPGSPPARRGAGAGRLGRLGRGGRHPGLLAAAAAPEAGRGGPGAVPVGRAAGQIHTAARDICAAAGYVGAGTVEFLVGVDGAISFLEVNTRLQVEHPVTEETSGIDLVRAQFRIADGALLADLGPGPGPARRAATRSSSGSTARTRGAASCRRRGR